MEPHERALFSVPPPQPPQIPTKRESEKTAGKARRQTVFNVAQGEVTTGPPTTRARPRQHTAVAAVLGGDLHSRIVRGGQSNKGEVDLEVLLHGVEKLCNVYPRPDALERIGAIRRKNTQQWDTMAYYESGIAKQQEEASRRFNKDHLFSDEEDDDEEKNDAGDDRMTEEELRREEEEVRRLERRQRELRERLRTMGKDMSGLGYM